MFIARLLAFGNIVSGRGLPWLLVRTDVQVATIPTLLPLSLAEGTAPACGGRPNKGPAWVAPAAWKTAAISDADPLFEAL